MTQKKLFEILKLIGTVYAGSHETAKLIVNEIENDNVTIIEKKWGDSFYSYKVLDLMCYIILNNINKPNNEE